VSASESTLLPLCALLPWFDRETIAAIASPDEDELTLLLESDLVATFQDISGAFRLRDAIRTSVQERLHTERPFDELDWHTRAFEFFLGRIAQDDPLARREDDERHCFYHLDRIFTFLYLRLEWQAISQHAAAARAAAPQQPQHLQRLAVYDAFVAIRTGDYEQGTELLDGLAREQSLEDDVRLNRLLALGHMQRNLTHYDQALAIYDQLSALALELDNVVYHGVALFNQGSVYTELDIYDRALDLVQKSLRIFEDHHDLDRLAYAHYAVGLNAMYLGRWQIAQEHYGEAIHLFEMLRMDATLATSYWSQGFLHLLLGNETASEAAYLRAVELTQSSQRGEPIVAMDARLQLGFLYYTQGRYDEALAACELASELALRLHHDHRASHIHFLRGRVLQAQQRNDEALAAYHQAIDEIEALREAHQREDIKISVLGTTQQVFEAAVLLCLELGLNDEAFEYVERARSRAFLDTLAQKLPELYETLNQPVVTRADVQAQLPADALLIEYYTTGVVPRGEHIINMLPKENSRLRAYLQLPPKVIMFAVSRAGLKVHELALDPNPLRPLVNDQSPGRRLLNPRLCAELYDRLIGPVQHLIADSRLLYLVPHGPLHYVPFQALCSPNGDYLLREDGPAIAQAPSATILLRLCLARPPAQSAEFLALGYNDSDTAALRYAENEARAIARLMGGAAWVGPEPKSEHLTARGARLRWLHIAGHAVYNPRDPLESHIQIGANDRLSAHTIMEQLDLRAELVTVSACTSGLSHVVPGDELLGLQRAFLHAGAATVVCALWEAYDLVALLVMEQLYQGLRQSRSVASALRDAQIAVRKMTGRDLAATFERWRAEDEDIALSGELPIIPPELYDTPLYTEPLYWAPFMVIGRA
jgi:CHAT domain-containing protein/tetratricopeptide (TPR) repeat protein